MPLDGSGTVLQYHQSWFEARSDDRPLSECSTATILNALGIEPVPAAVLQQHKIDEIAKHPASIFYRKPAMHGLAVGISFVGFITSVEAVLLGVRWPLVAVVGFMIAVLSATIFIKLMIGKVTGPARWIENPAYKFPAMPAQIMNLVRQVQTVAPNARFIIGTLYQERVALDPYILVSNFDRTTGSRTSACLGIWDGATIIHIAQQH